MNQKQFNIANIPVAPALVLAPMSGVTCSPFRRLIRHVNPGAVGLAVTEFISIEGLTRNNRRSVEMMRYREDERPISVQIFGHDVGRMVDAAKMVEATGADVVDINCGCPVPKVVRRGGGCELMRQPEHLARMLSAVRRAISIPLTVKIRSGWDEESKNGLEIARIVEEAGCAAIAIHGRTRKELYRGKSDWQIIGDIAEQLSIPVIGSGDVCNVEAAEAGFARGVSGVMLGRAALSNPWVFSEIHASLSGKPFEAPGPRETVEVIKLYLKMLSEEMPEKAVIGKMKQFSSQVMRRVPGSKLARQSLCRSQTLAEFKEQLARWCDTLPADYSLPGTEVPVLSFTAPAPEAA